MSVRSRWFAPLLTIVVCCCVLGFYRTTAVAQRTKSPAQPPFASAVEQRVETISELKGIRELLKEQNRLLSEQNELLKKAYPDAAQALKK